MSNPISFFNTAAQLNHSPRLSRWAGAWRLVVRPPVLLAAGCLLAVGAFSPRVDAVTLQIGSTNVNSGASFTVPLTVNAGAIVVGGVTATITFDTNLVSIISVTGGDTSQFSGTPTQTNMDIAGQVTIVAQQNSTALPTGLVSVAKFNFQSVGPIGTSALAIDLGNAEVDDANSGFPVPSLSTVDGSVTILAPLTCAVTPANATNCAGSSQIFVATPAGGLAPYTYSWSNGPTTQSNTVSSTGTYTCTIHDSNSSSAQGSGHLTVNSLPAAPTVGNNGPVCAGSTLNLAASTVGGATYSWTGPNSFSSGSQNPSISGATTAASGSYTVTVTVAGCTSTGATTTATVNPTSVGGTATPTTNTVCSGTGTSITLSGNTGNIVNWQSSLNNSTWSNLVSAANPLVTANLTTTSYFRAIVQSGICSTTTSSSAQVTVNPTVTPSVTVVADLGTNICTGSSVTFTATPVNGGPAPIYLWKKNGSSLGVSTNFYVDASLANGDYIDCQLTSDAPCASPTTANAARLTMTVAPTSVGGTTTPATNTVCNGSSTTIALAGNNGLITKWQSSLDNSTWSDIVSTATTLPTGSLTTNTFFRAIVQSGACSSTNSTSSQVAVSATSVGGTATPTASPICSGTGTTISLAGYTGAIVKWQSSTNNLVYTDIASTTNLLATGNLSLTTYFRAVVQSGACPTANSSVAQVTVTGIVTPSVTVAASPSTNICTGTSVLFTATPVNGGGSPSYVWKKNSGVVGTSANTYSDSGLVNGDHIDCQLTSSSACASTSTVNAATITMVVNAIPSAPTAGNGGPVCAGSILSLTASTVSSATYSWTGPNGFSSGQQNPAITNVTTAAAGLYSLTVTVSGCTSTAATTTVAVNASSVGGTTTAADPAVCSGGGTTITLTNQTGNIVKWQSSPDNSTWSDIAATNNPLATGVLVTNKFFRAVVQSATCPAANSASTQVSVSSVVVPSVTIAPDAGLTICAGTLVTFTATPVNGGPTPAFVWKKNGSVVGGSGPTYADSGLANGDHIDCQLTSSSTCASPSTANASELTMTVHAVPASRSS